jgi:hypothetical protein
VEEGKKWESRQNECGLFTNTLHPEKSDFNGRIDVSCPSCSNVGEFWISGWRKATSAGRQRGALLMDNKFSDTHIWRDAKYLWMTRNLATGIGGPGQTRDKAEKTFKLNWSDRGEIHWIESPPPPPKKPGEHTPIAEALEASEEHRPGYSTCRDLLKQHHSDLVGKRKFTADEVTAALIQLWEAVR